MLSTRAESAGRVLVDDPDQPADVDTVRRVFDLLPTVVSDTLQNGGNQNLTTYDLSQDGFTIGFAHNRTSDYQSFAQSTGSILFVATDAVTSYAVSGAYAISAAGGRLDVTLSDLTAGQKLFQHLQLANAGASGGAGGTFIVGGPGATGSPTGPLLRDHEYSFEYSADIVAPTTEDAGAFASGSVTLELLETPAPEPAGSSVVAGVMLLCTHGRGAVRRRKPPLLL